MQISNILHYINLKNILFFTGHRLSPKCIGIEVPVCSAMLCVSAAYAVARCLSVCLSVCVTVTFVHCVDTAKDTGVVAIECQ